MEAISHLFRPPESAGIAYPYICFSSSEQAEGDSKARQSATSEEYAQEDRLTIDPSLYLQDLSVSAFPKAAFRSCS